jgi:hypothetical protein
VVSLVKLSRVPSPSLPSFLKWLLKCFLDVLKMEDEDKASSSKKTLIYVAAAHRFLLMKSVIMRIRNLSLFSILCPLLLSNP